MQVQRGAHDLETAFDAVAGDGVIHRHLPRAATLLLAQNSLWHDHRPTGHSRRGGPDASPATAIQ
jgi:hypothetical protein